APRMSYPPVRLESTLRLDRCPHCGVAKPLLSICFNFDPKTHGAAQPWAVYECSACRRLVLATAADYKMSIEAHYPAGRPTLSDAVPERPREYLRQAEESLAQPAGSLILSAAAIDGMLQAKGFKDDRSLYTRIDAAAKEHLITADMAKWA